MLRWVHDHLDPVDSLGEVLFGLIMALTITLGVGLLSRRQGFDIHELVVGLVGCNLAWGIIDAVLYLLGSIFSRNQRVQFVRRLRAANEQQAIAAVREEFGLGDEPDLPQADRDALHVLVGDVLRRAGTERARLRPQDFKAAAAVAALVTLTAVPGALPFLFVSDAWLALRTANLIQVALLFWVGFHWAGYTGGNPWRTGAVILALGIVLVLVAVALGG
jgi:hypothetical protein